MDRRDFFRRLGLLTGGPFIVTRKSKEALAWGARAARELKAEVAIIGGGVGGVAAALAALRSGATVILTEETDWIGGQLTQQAVPPDEHTWIEKFGCTRSYRTFRNRVREYYHRNHPLSPEAIASPEFNPGNCGVSRICHEPRVAHSVLESLLAPYLTRGQLTLLLNCQPISAAVRGDRVEAVLLRNPQGTGGETALRASYFLDATETGDLLPLTGTEYVAGAESQRQTGELHAPVEANPQNMQAITWCFAVSYHEGEDHTIERPEEYGFWRDYVPTLEPPWPGRLLSFTYSHPISLQPLQRSFDPRPGAKDPGLWIYRRLIDPLNFGGELPQAGISLVNWPQNDYWLGNVIEVSAEEASRNLNRAMQLSYSLLYWLQAEAPRPDGGSGWPGLKLRGDLMATDHGLAKRPYIRESRRIKAEFTVLEQHVGTEARMKETGLPEGEVTAARFADSVGIGSYRIDLHPSTGGDNYIDVSSLPFEIPLGSLIPVRMENLLPACKNLGVTHITNGCFRLHPVEWNIGEAAGLLAAYCVSRSASPKQVRSRPEELAEFQRRVERQGIEIHWPEPMRSPR